MHSQDLRAQGEEEGITEEEGMTEEEGLTEEEGVTEEEEMTKKCQEVEAQDLRSERTSSRKPNLTLDQRTFLLMQKNMNATHKEIVKRWSARFTRKPPDRRTVGRILKRARDENSIKSRSCNSGRKRTIRTQAFMEEVKRKLDEQSTAKPNELVDRGNNNQFNLKRQSFYNVMKEIGYRP